MVLSVAVKNKPLEEVLHMQACQRSTRLAVVAFTVLISIHAGFAQIPGQFAHDFVAGRVPGPEEIAKSEADVAAHPEDYMLVRKLGKAYFFQYFGEGRASAVPKARKTLEHVLEI